MYKLIKVDRPTGLLSFNNLAEAYVLASLTRRFELPLQRVRNALRFVGGERPLLTTPFHDGDVIEGVLSWASMSQRPPESLVDDAGRDK